MRRVEQGCLIAGTSQARTIHIVQKIDQVRTRGFDPDCYDSMILIDWRIQMQTSFATAPAAKIYQK
jgi:hypothetical protein